MIVAVLKVERKHASVTSVTLLVQVCIRTWKCFFWNAQKYVNWNKYIHKNTRNNRFVTEFHSLLNISFFRWLINSHLSSKINWIYLCFVLVKLKYFSVYIRVKRMLLSGLKSSCLKSLFWPPFWYTCLEKYNYI